ncbi:MAG TPA: SDR family NAD(P)-dependent oxidoreductase [Nevskia sp.]|nr:SDR family NAD(P)-dependent oxidoreductase [Nevskia sp.]
MLPEALIPAGYTPAAGLLRGRVILVTGASGGVGAATAKACAQHGATVVLLGRNVKKLEKVYDEIESAGGPSPAIYPMNLAGVTWNEIAEACAAIEREFGRLDGLVHAAAHFTVFSPLSDVAPREWMESLQVNLTAAYTLTRLALPLLQKSVDVSVVFLTDPSGQDNKAYRGAFGVAKYALEGMVKSWASELEHLRQVRLNAYDPGPLRTFLRLKGFPGEDAQTLPGPESAVPGLLYLLGPDSRGLSGKRFSPSK